jgi:hypothetical protein
MAPSTMAAPQRTSATACASSGTSSTARRIAFSRFRTSSAAASSDWLQGARGA